MGTVEDRTVSDQLSLDDVTTGPGARRTDPRTSHIAADSQTPAKVGPIRAAVLLALWRRDPFPMTDAELWRELGGSESSPRKRRGELVAAGFVESCGETTSEFGMPTMEWMLTVEGRAFVDANRDMLIQQERKRKR